MISKFTEGYDNRHLLARQWKEEGKKIIGYTYSFVPEELIYAAGAIPVQITESEERSTVEVGASYIPEFFCDFCQSCAGQALEGMYGYLNGVVFANACVPLRVESDIWDLETKIPFLPITWPSIPSEESKTFCLGDFRRLKQKLEQLCGTEITDDSLRKAIDVYNENRRLLHQLYDLRKQDPPPISGSDVFEVVKAGLVMPKDKHNEMLRELLSQLGGNRGKKEGIRLMVSTLIFEEMAISRPNFVRMVENLGCNVVADDLCCGGRYFWDEAEIKPDLIESLVDRCLGKIPFAYRMPWQGRVKLLLDEALSSGVKGIMFFVPMYCESYLIEQPRIEERFRENNIPYLTIETEAAMAESTMTTRIEAFVETLR